MHGCWHQEYDAGMSDLRPCPACQRHIRIDEEACPFCATANVPAEPRRMPAGRFTRAAVFAGALAGSAALATGCGSSTPKPDDTSGGGDVTNNSGGGDPGATADAGTAEEGPDPDLERTRPDPDHDIPMPYGAPPARSRLV